MKRRLFDFFNNNKKRLFFALVLMAAVFVALVYFLLPKIEEWRQNEIVFRQGKISITRAELESSQKLERLLLEPFPAISSSPSSASPSPSLSAPPLPSGLSSPEGATEQFIRQRAIERVVQRKILEQEAAGLKIDLEKVKNETVLPAGVTAGLTDDGRFLPLPLFPVFAYDKSLLTAARRQVEGWAELILVTVVFADPKLKDEAAEITQNIRQTLARSPAAAAEIIPGEVSGKPGIRVSLIFQTVVGTTSAGLKSDEKAVYALNPFGYEYSFQAVSSKGAGLGADFEEWYGLAKKKYLEN